MHEPPAGYEKVRSPSFGDKDFFVTARVPEQQGRAKQEMSVVTEAVSLLHSDSRASPTMFEGHNTIEAFQFGSLSTRQNLKLSQNFLLP